MQIKFSALNFNGKPDNYAIVDKYISRSAQPKKEDFQWLKEQGVTDIINFRTMVNNEVKFNEENEVIKAGMKYHNIPSVTTEPKKKNINTFFKIIEDIKAKNGKAHLHCKAGADRTGMYTFIYEIRNGIKSIPAGLAEWYDHGYHYKRYPDLIKWTIKYINK